MQRLFPVAYALLVGACAFADTVETLDTTLLRKSCADPWLFRHGGKFYLTQTGTAKVRVLESDTLAGLAAADELVNGGTWRFENGRRTVDIPGETVFVLSFP